jgi:hypothetical protein
LLDGSIIANNWTGLTSGTLLHPINLDETGAVPAGDTEVWTGTNADGTSTTPDTCRDWNWNKPMSQLAEVGLYTATDSTWTAVYLQYCDRTMVHLYCFEQ